MTVRACVGVLLRAHNREGGRQAGRQMQQVYICWGSCSAQEGGHRAVHARYMEDVATAVAGAGSSADPI